MDDKVVVAIIGLASGAVSATVISFAAPWVKWAIEKRRAKLEYRKKIIELWRTAINKGFDANTFRETQEFSQMKIYLSQGIRKELAPISNLDDKVVIHLRSTIGVDDLRERLLDEISEIERKWKLI